MNVVYIWYIILFCLLLSTFVIVAMLWWNKKNIEHLKTRQILENNQHQELLKASILGQERERKRIAENLHDDIGPLLSIVKHSMAKNTTIKNNSELNELVNHAITSVKQMSLTLSPAILSELGLSEAVDYISEKFSESSSIKMDIHWDPEIENVIGPEHAIHVYRILQESLNNVLKHSNASHCIVRAVVMKDIVKLSIQDNGQGIVYSVERSPSIGLGLKSMEGRVELLGGSLNIKTKEGFLVSVIIPIV